MQCRAPQATARTARIQVGSWETASCETSGVNVALLPPPLFFWRDIQHWSEHLLWYQILTRCRSGWQDQRKAAHERHAPGNHPTAAVAPVLCLESTIRAPTDCLRAHATCAGRRTLRRGASTPAFTDAGAKESSTVE